jgi:hypothetical protein
MVRKVNDVKRRLLVAIAKEGEGVKVTSRMVVSVMAKVSFRPKKS